MEAEKQQKLYDALSKLAPRGKVGGLGYSSFIKQSKGINDDLPKNALYSNFVRAGSGLGQYHKRNFDDDTIIDSAEKIVKTNVSDDEKRIKKKKKKDKKQIDETESAFEMPDLIQEDITERKSKKKKSKSQPDVELSSHQLDNSQVETKTIKRKRSKEDPNKIEKIEEKLPTEIPKEEGKKKKHKSSIAIIDTPGTEDNVNNYEKSKKQKKLKKHKKSKE